MASYVDSNLMAQEKVLYRAHTSLWSLAPAILLGVVLLVVVVGLFILIWAWIRYKTTEFAVTDRRVIAKSGLISRRTVEMFLDKVESLNVEQSVPGRLFDYGTVTIRGTGATSEPFADIKAPLALRKSFMDAADAYRRKS
jgi:uncharacterized membrane protein YdbT with pleckstrin-like domain